MQGIRCWETTSEGRLRLHSVRARSAGPYFGAAMDQWLLSASCFSWKCLWNLFCPHYCMFWVVSNSLCFSLLVLWPRAVATEQSHLSDTSGLQLCFYNGITFWEVLGGEWAYFVDGKNINNLWSEDGTWQIAKEASISFLTIFASLCNKTLTSVIKRWAFFFFPISLNPIVLVTCFDQWSMAEVMCDIQSRPPETLQLCLHCLWICCHLFRKTISSLP